jgi:hypothetical protein
MTTLPTWLAVLLALASPIVAVVAIGAGELRDRRRLEHEREMQELEEHRMTRLREERLRAYSTFARLTKTVEAENPTPGPALAEAHSEIEMLTDNPELRTAAAVLLQAWGEAWNIARAELERGADNPYGAPDFMMYRDLLDGHRTTFLRLARDELQAKPLSRLQ